MEQQIADLAAQFGSAWATWLARVQSSPQQMAAHGAIAFGFGLTLLGAYARTMMPLRWLAVAAGVASLTYALLAPSPITLITAGLLLPLNLWRAIEVTRLTRRVRRAGVQAEMAGVWLKPYMKSRRLKAGQTLFAKGDLADRLYMLVHGEAVLAEIGRPLEAGRIFGEIALFSPDQTRTQTVRAVSECTVLEIEGSTVKELFYQSPAFGFHLIELLAGRLGADVQRAQRKSTPGEALAAG